MRIVLASSSPRRAALMRAAGFTFDTFAVDLDERVRPGESPDEYVRRLAAEKSALADAALDPDMRAIVLGADTTVVVDGDILAKPSDAGAAAGMLRRLSGRRHLVLTGLSLRWGGTEVGQVETTTVYFADLPDQAIAWYVQSGEWRDKAGGYAIQGLASRFVPRIEGSYTNVVGLPVATVCRLLDAIPHLHPGL